MSIRLWRAGLSGLAIALVPLNGGVADEIVGNRFFGLVRICAGGAR
ncbi:hypothetical protein SAMN05443247_06817 [Bradyrhizobium erythrophlei]|jgi:hypothetical protein|nr:hypothetical protein SAMN05443247_06817 [Bradyrhizobium erythrophlei]